MGVTSIEESFYPSKLCYVALDFAGMRHCDESSALAADDYLLHQISIMGVCRDIEDIPFSTCVHTSFSFLLIHAPILPAINSAQE
jgi:hypothetical protein